jgi:hypothetical protein
MEVDCPSLVFIDFNVSMLTPGCVLVFWECSPPWALSSSKRSRLLKVRVTLQLMVGQSVSLGVELHEIFIHLWQLQSSFCGVHLCWEDGSFVCAAGPHQHSLSWVCVPWDSQPYFTVSLLRLPFPLPPTARRVTVYVFHLASTRVSSGSYSLLKQIRYSTIKTDIFCTAGLTVSFSGRSLSYALNTF